MKSLSGFALFTLSVAFCGVAAETTNTFYVAEGETKTVDEIVAANGFAFKDGDWIRKTGKGQLNAVTTYKNVQLNLLIEEGVYFLPDSLGDVVHANGARIVIKNGAALNIEGVHTVQTADDKKQSYPLIGGSVDVLLSVTHTRFSKLRMEYPGRRIHFRPTATRRGGYIEPTAIFSASVHV